MAATKLNEAKFMGHVPASVAGRTKCVAMFLYFSGATSFLHPSPSPYLLYCLLQKL